MALCKIHHSAYDANILGIDPECRIHVSQRILDEHDGTMLRYGLQGLNEEKLQVLPRRELRPNASYLEERFRRFEAA